MLSFVNENRFQQKDPEISQPMIVLGSNLVKTPLTNYATMKLMANTFTIFTSTAPQLV